MKAYPQNKNEDKAGERDVVSAVRVAMARTGWRVCPACGELSIPPGPRSMPCLNCTRYELGPAAVRN